MRRFSFRLQKVLEYRALQEQWAKEAWLEARSLRFAAEMELQRAIREKARAELILPANVEEMQALDLYLEKLSDDIEAHRAIVDTLLLEEQRAHDEWVEARRNHEVLCRLRDRAYKEWELAKSREEQKALDDWTNSRREAS